MTLLKDITLYVSAEEFGREYCSEFQFKTRYLCNYVRRGLVAQKISARGYRTIVIQGTRKRDMVGECRVEGERALVPYVPFDASICQSLVGEKLHEFYIDMMFQGLRVASKEFVVPYTEIVSLVDSFRRGGYINEWRYKEKVWRSKGVRACLDCRIDQSWFYLRLTVTKDGVQFLSADVLKTLPDETIFAHRFKDIVFDEGRLVVVERSGETLFAVDV